MKPGMQLTDDFKKRLYIDFRNYCHRSQLSLDINLFINFMIDQDVIRAADLRKYLIIRELGEVRSDGPNKTQTVKRLSQKYHICDRTIWHILKKNQQ